MYVTRLSSQKIEFLKFKSTGNSIHHVEHRQFVAKWNPQHKRRTTHKLALQAVIKMLQDVYFWWRDHF